MGHSPRLSGLTCSGTWPAEPSRADTSGAPTATRGDSVPPPATDEPPNDDAPRRSATGLPMRLPLTPTPVAPRTMSPAGLVCSTVPLPVTVAAPLRPSPERGEARCAEVDCGGARDVAGDWPPPR